MNLVLLFQEDFINDDQVKLTDRRLTHIQTIHKAKVGDTLTVGFINGDMGSGKITVINNDEVLMTVALDTPPPASLPLTLIIALPRPKMLKRILQTCATMGAKKIILINSYRVEKSYWQTPLLSDVNIREYLTLGLEQAKDTVMPEVILEKRFKPFVEDQLPTICKNTVALVAHPNSAHPCPTNLDEMCTLVIGPEGGFIPYEIDKLNQAGCKSIHIGNRILRVETAVPVLLSKLFDF